MQSGRLGQPEDELGDSLSGPEAHQQAQRHPRRVLTSPVVPITQTVPLEKPHDGDPSGKALDVFEMPRTRNLGCE